MASIAQMLMSLVLLAFPPSHLMKLEGMNATCGNILSYSNRHMARVESLLQKTFLFDLVLQSGITGLALQDDADGKVEGSSIGELIVVRPEHTPEHALKRTMDVLLGQEEDDDDVAPGQEVDDTDEEPTEGTPAQAGAEARAEAGADSVGKAVAVRKRKRRRQGGA